MNIFFTSIAIFIALGLQEPLSLFAQEHSHIPLLEISAGYLDAGKYSNALLQCEYKCGNYLWKTIKPQITLLLTKSYSGYIGFGVGWELYLTKQVVMTPSFSPGLYWKGKGRDLGCVLEFRSALEICYEMKNKLRIGVQISHVSNGHLSQKNPGFNAFVLCFAFPLKI